LTDIRITVTNKIAVAPAGTKIVCGNSDYRLIFDFDSRWAAEKTKTVRFVWNSKGRTYHKDVPMDGDTLNMPVISNTLAVLVGVYAGNLRTTTPVKIHCEPSILCCGGQEENIDSGAFAQMQAELKILQSKSLRESDVWNIVDKYLSENPADDEDFQEIVDMVLSAEKIAQIQQDIADLKNTGTKSTMVVTLEYGSDGEFPVANHSASEIIAHIEKGGSVILLDSHNIATLFNIYDTYVSFLRCDNFGERTTYAILEDKTCQKITMGQETVSEKDNGKVMQVVNGKVVTVDVKNSSIATYIDEYISSALEGEY
jgi:hypothetical protein